METTDSGFDPSVYFATKPLLTVHQGYELDRMMQTAKKYGPRFWGIDLGLPIAPTPDDMRHRLLFFGKILERDPKIDSETYEALRMRSEDVRQIGQKALSSTITLQKEKKGGKISRPKIKTTYADALSSDPEIFEQTYQTMFDEDDPVARTIATLEDWRFAQDEENAPSTQQLRLGFEAYQVALLGYRRDRAQQIIANLAIANHEVVNSR